MAKQVQREQRAGHVSDVVDVDLVAEMMVRMSTSFLLTPEGLVELDDDEQVGHIARRFIVPMLSEPDRP